MAKSDENFELLLLNEIDELDMDANGRAVVVVDVDTAGSALFDFDAGSLFSSLSFLDLDDVDAELVGFLLGFFRMPLNLMPKVSSSSSGSADFDGELDADAGLDSLDSNEADAVDSSDVADDLSELSSSLCVLAWLAVLSVVFLSFFDAESDVEAEMNSDSAEESSDEHELDDEVDEEEVVLR